MSDPRYRTTRWLRMRKQQLAREVLCKYCLLGVCQHTKQLVKGRKDAEGNPMECLTLATVADHIEPHRGDGIKFWNFRNLQSLCATCHSSFKQMMENRPAGEVDHDGYAQEG